MIPFAWRRTEGRALVLVHCLVGTAMLTSSWSSSRAGPPDAGSTSVGTDAPTGAWRRIERPGSAKASAFVSIADVERSDPRLAGLMLRCGGHKIEAVFVIVGAFPPGSRPKITLRAKGEESYFDASVIQAGTGLLVPAEKLTSRDGTWRAAGELAVQIAGTDSGFGGIVPLEGLETVVTSLNLDCAQEQEQQ